jgi:hypothetical protein
VFATTVKAANTIAKFFRKNKSAGGLPTLKRHQTLILAKTQTLSFCQGTRWGSEVKCVSSVCDSREPLQATVADVAWNNTKSSAAEIVRTVGDDGHFDRSRALVAFAEASRYAMVVLQATVAGLADVYSQMLHIDISVRDLDSSIIGVAAKRDLLAKWVLRVEFMYHPGMLVAWAIDPKYASVSSSVSTVVILRWMRKIMQPIDDISFEKVKKGYIEFRAMVRRQDPEIWTNADVADGAKWHQDFTGHVGVAPSPGSRRRCSAFLLRPPLGRATGACGASS